MSDAGRVVLIAVSCILIAIVIVVRHARVPFTIVCTSTKEHGGSELE